MAAGALDLVKLLNTKKKKRNPEEEQRRWPRLKPSSVRFLKSVTFNQGSEVHVINISRGGMLLETEVRLRPQMKITLKLVTSDGLIKLPGVVLRSSIVSLEGGPRFQTAISFENPFHMLDDLSAEPELSAGHSPENDQAPALQTGTEQPASDDDAILTFVAPDMPGASLLELFKTNDW
jgi:hypothetical protein